jgi:Peptidase A4 family
MKLRRKRYIIPALAAAAIGVFPAAASAQAVNAQQAASENWAGYIADSNVGNGQFSAVSGSWVEPSVSSSASQGYSAFWVGLGGSSNQSQALEQVGTSADTVNGQAKYYAWYELVPAPETQLNLAVHPGDHITGKVSVSGTAVTISLWDTTTGQSVTKHLQMSNPDTSSAEWIAEAPSSQSQDGSYQPLPLADFGKVTFTGASATSNGHTGSISDSDWSLQQVQLTSPSGSGNWAGGGAGIAGSGQGFVSTESGAGAQTSSLSTDGSSFSVSWSQNGPAVTGLGSGTSTGGTGTGAGSGSSYPYGPGGTGDPYGSGGGYGYGGGSGYGAYGYGGYGGGYGYGGYGYGI